MADIKQIKVGTTLYNIEPYTKYLPLSGGTMDGGAWINFYSSPTLGVEYMTDIQSEGLDLTHVTSYGDKTTQLSGGNLVISENFSDGAHEQIDISSTQIAFTKGPISNPLSTILLYSSDDNTLMTTGNLSFSNYHGINMAGTSNGFYNYEDYPVIATDDRSIGVSTNNGETVEWFYFPETNGNDSGTLTTVKDVQQMIQDYINEAILGGEW